MMQITARVLNVILKIMFDFDAVAISAKMVNTNINQNA